MGSTFDLLLQQLESTLSPDSPTPSPQTIISYIRDQGGVAKMHDAYQRLRLLEKQENKKQRVPSLLTFSDTPIAEFHIDDAGEPHCDDSPAILHEDGSQVGANTVCYTV